MDAPLNTQTSEFLMLDYAAGNADAFTALYGMHKGPLFRFLLRQGLNKAKADEMFQEIWLKVINARESYQPSARFQTWLYTLARNLVIDEFRQNGKAEIVELLDEHSDTTEASALDENIDRERKQKHILSSVEALPFEQRQAFLLRYEAGLNSADIAQITGTNQETAKSRVRYAIKQLKMKLGGSQ